MKSLTIFSLFSEFLPLLFAIIFRKKINQASIKVFFVYCLLLFSFGFLSVFSFAVLKNKIFYLLVSRIDVVVEFTLVFCFFSYIFRNRTFNKAAVAFISIFWAYCIFNYLSSGANTYDNTPSIIEFLVCIALCCGYFIYKTIYTTQNKFTSLISFWVAVGLLLHFLNTLSYMLYIPFVKDVAERGQISALYSFLAILKDIIFALAWLGTEKIETDADLLENKTKMVLQDDDGIEQYLIDKNKTSPL